MNNQETFELSELINRITNLIEEYGEIDNLLISCDNCISQCEIRIDFDYGGD